MAAAKTSTSILSCFTFLKEALILLTRNPKLFTPIFILIALPTFVGLITYAVFVHQVVLDMAEISTKLQNTTTDPSSPEYRSIMEEMVEHNMTPVFVYGGAATLGSVVLGFVKPCVAFFAASSTFAGNRYSLPELHRKAMKGNLKGPLITIAMVTLLQFMVYLGKLPYDVVTQRHWKKVFSVPRPLLFLCYLASNYLKVVGMVSVAVSVSDKKKNCRGIHALRKAWLLMTRVRRNQGIVLAVVVFLLPKAIGALNLDAVADTKNMALGICLFAVFALLSAGEQLFCFAATMVYCFGASVIPGQANC